MQNEDGTITISPEQLEDMTEDLKKLENESFKKSQSTEDSTSSTSVN